MESVFEIIAEPNRRAILSLLVSSEQSVGEIERQLRMPQPTVSKHLRVLRDAGFVESTVDAQRRLYRLKPEPLQELDARHRAPEAVPVSAGKDAVARPPWIPRSRRHATRAGALTQSAAAYEADVRSLPPTVGTRPGGSISRGGSARQSLQTRSPLFLYTLNSIYLSRNIMTKPGKAILGCL